MVKEETDETNSVTKLYTWDDISRILEASGHTGGMKRMFDNRIKYRMWLHKIIERYGSVTDYIYHERLKWTPLRSLDGSSETLAFEVKDPVPFANSQDYKLMWNDWPYGSFEPEVKHLIVWLKAPLGCDGETGRLPGAEIATVQAFVDKTFIHPMEAAGMSDAHANLIWFKNDFALQSIRFIDHFHVLVKDVPPALLFEWTKEPEPIV